MKRHVRRLASHLLATAITALVAHSAHAGWEVENSMFSNTSAVTSVAAVDASRGFAAGIQDTGQSQNGVLLSTTDGTSWSPVFQVSSGTISAVWFDDATTGYIAGLTIEGFNFIPFLQRTTSGGSSFTEVDHPEPDGWTDVKIPTKIYVAPGGDGFALLSDGGLWRSTDDGSSWTDVAMPTEGVMLNGIHFVDADHGWIVGGNPGDSEEGTPPGNGTIVRTTDGGASWSIVSSGRGENLSDVVFFNPTSGIVVGYDDQRAHIYTTADGGASLDESTLPTDGEGRSVGYLSAVEAPCGNQAWAAGAIYTTESQETGITALLFSDDGGLSWSLDPWPQEFVEGQFEMAQYHTLLDLDFAGSDVGLAGGTEFSVLGYSGEGLDCTPPDESPLADDDEGGAGGCDCQGGDETAARTGALPQLTLAALALTALGIRRRT